MGGPLKNVPLTIRPPNSEFDLLCLLNYPTHLLKNIWNNWEVEKTQTLCFTDAALVKQ